MLVLPNPLQSYTIDALKRMLVNDNSCFFLRLAQRPGARHQTLWYRYFATDESTVATEIKVDIALPGIMHLPNLPLSRIHWIQHEQISPHEVTDRLPLLPPSVILLQKLQAWRDLRFAKHKEFDTVPNDVLDIQDMLKLPCVLALASHPGIWKDSELFDEEFQRLTQGRMREFCYCYGSTSEVWTTLGFDTSGIQVSSKFESL
jgi:hypothetical protein